MNSKRNDVAADYSRIIDSIEEVRSRNNINWMDVLRLAFKYAPEEAVGLVKKIHDADREISSLLEQLTQPPT